MSGLEGRVALVTGAAQGIGQSLAVALAAEGTKLVVSDIKDTSETVAAVRDVGAEALGCHSDITDNASLAAMVEETEEKLGPINVLVNNAGLFSSLELKPLLESTEDEFDLIMKVNVRGLFQTSKAVFPSMVKAGGGSIINIGSGTMLRGAPLLGPYVASKGAVFALSRTMAREFAASDIRVNCVMVGFTASKGVVEHPDMLTKYRENTIAARILKRDMQPEDLSGTIVYLAGNASAFITGQAFNVDGGAVTY